MEDYIKHRKIEPRPPKDANKLAFLDGLYGKRSGHGNQKFNNVKGK